MTATQAQPESANTPAEPERSSNSVVSPPVDQVKVTKMKTGSRPPPPMDVYLRRQKAAKERRKLEAKAAKARAKEAAKAAKTRAKEEVKAAKDKAKEEAKAAKANVKTAAAQPREGSVPQSIESHPPPTAAASIEPKSTSKYGLRPKHKLVPTSRAEKVYRS